MEYMGDYLNCLVGKVFSDDEIGSVYSVDSIIQTHKPRPLDGGEASPLFKYIALEVTHLEESEEWSYTQTIRLEDHLDDREV